MSHAGQISPEFRMLSDTKSPQVPALALAPCSAFEADEDAFEKWNRDVTDYVPTLWDAYLFGLSRGRSGTNELGNALACVLGQAPGRDNRALFVFGRETLNRWECVHGRFSDMPANHHAAHETRTSP